MKNLSTMELWRRSATWLAPVLTGLALLLAPSGAAQAQALPLAPASARAAVPEAGDYGILYQLDIPTVATFNHPMQQVPYSIDKSAVEMVNPARVAYYLELTNGATTTYVWTSMANFATTLTQLGIPNPTYNNVSLHQNVSSLNVFSNVTGVTTGTNLGTGRIEMWPTNYNKGNADNVPNADPKTYDFGDQVDLNGSYGSFQVHNVTAAQTVFAYNNWGGNGGGRGYGDLGIGSQAGGNSQPDWTFAYNANQYTVKRITILVKTLANALADLVVSTGTQTNPTPIPPGNYNSITVTRTGNGVLTGNVTVNSFLSVEPGGGLSDGCSVISGPGSFTLGAGTILGICNAAGITSSGPTGTVQVTGTRSFSTGASYGYTGAAAVTGNGLPGTVANLAIITVGNVTLTAPVAVSVAAGVFGAGNLVLNGNALTLLSSASGTALVVNAGAGKVIGATATVQRYIDPSKNPGLGYRHYSAPVKNTTVADLAIPTIPATTTIPAIPGFAPTLTTSYNASATPGSTTPFPTVFGYDQSRVALTNAYAPFDRGFVVPVSTDVPLAVGQGYAVNIAGNQLVDFVGTLTTGDQSPVALSRVVGNPDAGWQLLGNPYPAPLDYGRVAPIDRPNLDAAIYVYSSTGPYVGTYRAYLPPADGTLAIGNGVLPVAQGFFVRVSAGQTSGSLTFRNSQRLTSPQATTFQRGTAGTRPLVQLELRGATGLADTFYAYATAGATPAFDSQLDAVKLPNTTGLNLASRAEGAAEGLAIDARPVFAAATVLPLTVGVPAAGSYTLSATALTQLPAGLSAYLHDAATGQTINLSQQPRYAFAVSPAQAQAGLSTRFSLGFSPQGILATHAGLHASEVSLFPNPAHASFTVLVPAVTGSTQLRAELLNSLGQVVRRLSAALPAEGASLHVDTADLAGGVYILRLYAGPTTLTKRVVLQ